MKVPNFCLKAFEVRRTELVCRTAAAADPLSKLSDRPEAAALSAAEHHQPRLLRQLLFVEAAAAFQTFVAGCFDC